ncbi:transcriptional regulator, TrmB [Desulfuromonas soudanensis]|uniref:Transcriptional regulator, TrmB n=1 Tax=Desulfuromonas soudanensis TaxID=1603606 RepID=A0A0M4D2L7_9BACT|nr:MarR family winged helix-turn-helix transcriptional regulator [Desulfuromonas soudanensis]ALC17258.1 transcriptional regulator, TrmB [Desulfuromonas soudanensis]
MTFREAKPSGFAQGTDIAADPGATILSYVPQIPKGSYELRILQSLRQIIRAIEIHSHKLVQDYQITGPQLNCLLALQEHESLTPTALAHIVYLSPSTIVGIVDRLEEKGLVDRSRSSRDRRQVQITITAAGRELTTSAPSPLQETLVERLRALPETEQVTIIRALEKVADLMDARKIDAGPVLETGPLLPPAHPK